MLTVKLGSTSSALHSVLYFCPGELVQGALKKGVGMWGCFSYSFPKYCVWNIQFNFPHTRKSLPCLQDEIAGIFVSFAIESDELYEQSQEECF